MENGSYSEEKISISTPEQVEFEYELAGLGSRFLAFFLDGAIRGMITLILVIICIIVLSVCGLASGEIKHFLESMGKHFEKADQIFLWFLGIAVFIFYLINSGYFIFFETVWNGQTPGKRILGLRVVKEGGFPIGFYEAAIRNFLRIADALPVNYLAGALAILFSPKNKRIGDYVAGTIVIKERKETLYHHLSIKEGPGIQMIEEAIPYLGNISHQEYEMVVEFLSRYREMDKDYVESMAVRFVNSLKNKLSISKPLGVSYIDFLKSFVHTYQEKKKFI